MKFLDSRHFQWSIYTVFDEESDFQVKNKQTLDPGGKIEEKPTTLTLKYSLLFYSLTFLVFEGVVFFLFFGLRTPEFFIFDLKIGFLVKNCTFRLLEMSTRKSEIYARAAFLYIFDICPGICF